MSKVRLPPRKYLPLLGAHALAVVNFMRPKLGFFYILAFDPVSTTYKVWEACRSIRAAQKSLELVQDSPAPYPGPFTSAYIVFYTGQVGALWSYISYGGVPPV